jgi:hypothetical protein
VKATVVSLIPRPIKSHMPGLHPEYYLIPAAPKDSYETLLVEDTFFYSYRLDGEHIRVSEPGERVAAAIVRDFISSQLGLEDGARPGLFFVTGEQAKDDIKFKFEKELAAARTVQNNWFKSLVRMADDSWKDNKKHKSISDLQRSAAMALNLNREWASAVIENELCPACGSILPNANVTKCAACQTIIKPKEHNAKFGSLVTK